MNRLTSCQLQSYSPRLPLLGLLLGLLLLGLLLLGLLLLGRGAHSSSSHHTYDKGGNREIYTLVVLPWSFPPLYPPVVPTWHTLVGWSFLPLPCRCLTGMYWQIVLLFRYTEPKYISYPWKASREAQIRVQWSPFQVIAPPPQPGLFPLGISQLLLAIILAPIGLLVDFHITAKPLGPWGPPSGLLVLTLPKITLIQIYKGKYNYIQNIYMKKTI